MNVSNRYKIILIFILASAIPLFFFQNCSKNMQFSTMENSTKLAQSTGPEAPDASEDYDVNEVIPEEVESEDPKDVISNPLGNQDGDYDPKLKNGLKGNLFYLTESLHSARFSGDLRNAVLNDYQTYGVKVDKSVVMTQINISSRAWTDGFFTGSGEIVKTEDGSDLMEWFSLKLSGKISLPAGTYEFAMISDDGMRVSIMDQRLLDDDGTHSPRQTCSSQSVSFVEGDAFPIQVEYFQGPRTQIAMQLLMRPSLPNENCMNKTDWMEVPASAFSH